MITLIKNSAYFSSDRRKIEDKFRQLKNNFSIKLAVPFLILNFGESNDFSIRGLALGLTAQPKTQILNGI